MCWLPINQPLLLPGDSTCSSRGPSPCSVAQLLASRLRRIGDQLEKSWTVREEEEVEEVEEGRKRRRRKSGFGCGGDRGTVVMVTGRGHLKSLVRTAIQLTVLVLVVARRHL